MNAAVVPMPAMPLDARLARVETACRQSASAPCRDDRQRTGIAISSASRFIEAHLDDSLTLADIAGAACVSKFHFARLFRRSTGLSPMEYVLHRRIVRAKDLLSRPGRSLSAIAIELGFFDQSHFTRSFRRATGMTPGAYVRDRIDDRPECGERPSRAAHHRAAPPTDPNQGTQP